MSAVRRELAVESTGQVIMLKMYLYDGENYVFIGSNYPQVFSVYNRRVYYENKICPILIQNGEAIILLDSTIAIRNNNKHIEDYRYRFNMSTGELMCIEVVIVT